MIEYIVIGILFIIVVVLFTLLMLKKDCPKTTEQVCDDTTIMKIDYDYPQGERPPKTISDVKASGIESKAGNDWTFLW